MSISCLDLPPVPLGRPYQELQDQYSPAYKYRALYARNRVAERSRFPPPWTTEFRMAIFQFGTQMATCLGNNQHTPFHQPAFFPTCFGFLQAHVLNNAANAFNSLNDVSQSRYERAVHH